MKSQRFTFVHLAAMAPAILKPIAKLGNAHIVA